MFKLLILLSLSLNVFASEPSITLIARANVEDGFRLPAFSFIDNISPAINDKGSVAFKVLSFLDGQSGVVLVPAKNEESTLVYASLPELYVTDVSITASEDVYFSEFSEIGPVGLFHFAGGKLNKLFSSDDLFELSAIGTPAENSEGFCVRVTKGSDARQSREVHCSSEPGKLEKFFGEGQAQLRASYLFTPAFNEKKEFAAKMRLGARGDFAEERPDVIALVDESGAHVLMSDFDADPTSLFVKFNNSVALNKLGEVALVGTTKHKQNCVILASKTSMQVKVCEGQYGIKEIEYFTPQINNVSSIAFRAIDEEGKRQIYLMKKEDLAPRKLLGEGSIVPTDLGPGKIILREGFPGLSGNIGLNNLDQIVFHAVLEDSGAGIFVITENP